MILFDNHNHNNLNETELFWLRLPFKVFLHLRRSLNSSSVRACVCLCLVCVWVPGSVFLACIYAWANVYPTFMAICLVKQTDTRRQPALRSTGSPTGSPGATTYQEGLADASPPRWPFQKSVSSRITAWVTTLVTARTRAIPPSLKHMCTRKDALKTSPWIDHEL